MAIEKVTEQSKENIKRESVLALPNNPSQRGYTAQQLKEYFTNIVLGDFSAISEMNRIVDEINLFIGGIDDIDLKNYITNEIVAMFNKQAPYINLYMEGKMLKFVKFGTPTSISGEIDIIPSDSVFVEQDQLKSKNGNNIFPKTSIDKLIDIIDNKNIRDYITGLNSQLIELNNKHNADVVKIKEDLEAIVGGDAPQALDTIKELAEALNNNPQAIDDILQKLADLETNKVSKVLGKDLSTNDYTNEDKNFLDKLRTEEVATKADIPTKLSELLEDVKHRTVTDLEKEDWNSKANGIHKHEINDINGLQKALDDKSNVGHTHTLDSLGAEAKGKAKELVDAHNISMEAHSDIREKIAELTNKIDGINNAIAFDTKTHLENWLNGTYARPDGKTPENLFIGQHIYISDVSSDDYWVSMLPVNTIQDLSILNTDKINLNDYAKKDELNRVSFTGNYNDLVNKPTIPTKLSELNEDDAHKTITKEKLELIDANATNINKKVDKSYGSSNKNKILVTDDNGNIQLKDYTNTAIIEDSLTSNATDIALSANQGRILNNKKLDKQQGVENKGKILYVDEIGNINAKKEKDKTSELINDSDFATNKSVDEKIAKIPTPDVSGQIQAHNEDLEAHPDIRNELDKKVSQEDATGTTPEVTPLDNYYTKTQIRDKIYPIGTIYMSVNNTSPASLLGGSWEALPSGKALWTTNSNAGQVIEQGLPNIKGELYIRSTAAGGAPTFINGLNKGAFTTKDNLISETSGGRLVDEGRNPPRGTEFNANKSNPIYKDNSGVQPPAYTIFAWKRTA